LLCEYELAKQFLIVLIKCGTSEIKNKYRFSPTANGLSATVKFIRKMNKFFDCLNTRNLYEGRNTRNPNLAPYTAIDDARLTWLIDDFLKYFDDWKVAVENRPGQFSKSEKSAMMLSYQTLEGFQITAKSIVACVK
jgi:hypothetical protein